MTQQIEGQAFRITRITKEIWTGKKWKKISQETKRERIPTLNERLKDIIHPYKAPRIRP